MCPRPILEDLGEAGGVLSAPSNAPGLPESLGHLGLVCTAVGVRKPGGALAATSVTLACTVVNVDEGEVEV
jgi:hypothetical protein